VFRFLNNQDQAGLGRSRVAPVWCPTPAADPAQRRAGFAVVALREHLGRKELRADPNYTDFAQAFSTFVEDLHSDTRRIDHYLWLIGQYRRRTAERVNAEITRVFDANPRELAQLTACVGKQGCASCMHAPVPLG